MPRYVLTGTPGAGKTAVLRLLEVNGHAVVEEAATDIIALDDALGQDRSHHHAFIDRVVSLQRQRQHAVAAGVVFFDRSPVCTLALSHYVGVEPSPLLAGEVDRVMAEGVYERRCSSSVTRVSFSQPPPGGSAWRMRSSSSGSTSRRTATSGSTSSRCRPVR